jgi:hypothetical protein
MPKFRTRALGAAIAAGALVALPASASASPFSVADKVTKHTDRVDAALDRATDLFAADRERPAVAAVFRSRAELRHATAIAARAVRRADTPEERADAADAVIEVGTQLDEDVPLLVGLIDQADDPRADALLARLALSDARARERAIAILERLVDEGLPADAEAAVADAIAALSTDRSSEIAAATEALSGADEPVASQIRVKLRLVIEVSFRGQARAAGILNDLIGQLSAAAQQQVQAALDALNADHAQAADERDRASAPPAPEDAAPPAGTEDGTTPPDGTATGTTPPTGTEGGTTPPPPPAPPTGTEDGTTPPPPAEGEDGTTPAPPAASEPEADASGSLDMTLEVSRR